MKLWCEYPIGKYRHVDLGPDSEWDEDRIRILLNSGLHWVTDNTGWTFDLTKVVGWQLQKDNE